MPEVNSRAPIGFLIACALQLVVPVIGIWTGYLWGGQAFPIQFAAGCCFSPIAVITAVKFLTAKQEGGPKSLLGVLLLVHILFVALIVFGLPPWSS